MARLEISGPRAAAGTLGAGLDPDPALPDCGEGIPYPDPLPPFTATISTDPASGTAALCRTDPEAEQLFGTLASGGRLDVSASTEGAVLGDPCAAACVATMTLTVRGTLSGQGASLRLDGAVVERLAPRAGADCGSCVLPCAARYAAAGVPAPP